MDWTMELRHLRYFIAVAEEGSLTLAAERRLHTAQPSLSRQIRDLELEVGAQLLIRGPRGIELTPAGRAFLDHARLALSQVEVAGEAARRASQVAKESFVLGFLTGHEVTWLPEALRILRDDQPNIEVIVHSQLSPDLARAQFEREVTSERIRDKIAASKRKGLWVGGPLPLGYHMKDDKIAVVEDEAERVRLIFRRYLELGGVNALVRNLRERGIRTKSRRLATGATRGGVLFGRGSLFYLLRNRFYVGEVKYKNEVLPGEQPAIMDRALFDAVQQKLTDQWTTRSTTRNASDQLLTGLLFDNAGHRMVPTHTTKAGVRYRYYVSLPHLHGESKTASVGSISRVPATDIENVIVKSLNEHLIAQKEKPASSLTQP